LNKKGRICGIQYMIEFPLEFPLALQDFMHRMLLFSHEQRIIMRIRCILAI
jgi:hypothetical protein